MKKRKLFVGVLLASAVFSLAACSGGTADTTTSGTTPTTTTTTTTTQSGTTTTTTSTTTQSGTTTTTTSTTTQSGTQTDQVTVSFKTKIDGTAVTTNLKEVQAQTIDKGSIATLPSAADMAVTGYKFVGFETATGTAITDTTTFNKNTTVYCSYDTEHAGYVTLSADTTNNVVAYDFTDKTASDTVSKFTSYGTKGIYDKGESTAAQVSFENRKAKVTCDNSKKGQLIIDLGETITNSTITGCYEVYVDDADGDKFGYFNLVDTDGNTAFAISMRGNKGSRVLGYKNGSEDVESTTDFKPSTKYFVEYSVNLVAKKATIKLDGTTVYDNVSVPNLGTSVKALRFETKDSKCNLIVDAIAVNKEAAQVEQYELDRNAAIQAIDTYLDSEGFKALDDVIKTKVTSLANNKKTALNAATTVEGVASVKSEWDAIQNSAKYVITVTPYTAASEPVTGVEGKKVAYIASVDAGATFVNTLKAVSFTGYTINNIYTDQGLSTALDTAAFTDNTTVYASVTVSAIVTKTLDIATLLGSETSYTLTKGQVYNDIFTIWGKDVADTDTSNITKRDVVIKKDGNGVARLEVTGGGLALGSNEHKPANCVGVQCSKAGTIKVKMINKNASTDTANYGNKECKVSYMTLTGEIGTSAVAINGSITKCDYKMPASDKYDDAIEYEITVTEAGTYYIGASHNGCYIYSISFTA